MHLPVEILIMIGKHADAGTKDSLAAATGLPKSEFIGKVDLSRLRAMEELVKRSRGFFTVEQAGNRQMADIIQIRLPHSKEGSTLLLMTCWDGERWHVSNRPLKRKGNVSMVSRMGGGWSWETHWRRGKNERGWFLQVNQTRRQLGNFNARFGVL